MLSRKFSFLNYKDNKCDWKMKVKKLKKSDQWLIVNLWQKLKYFSNNIIEPYVKVHKKRFHYQNLPDKMIKAIRQYQDYIKNGWKIQLLQNNYSKWKENLL